jgi:hypothetical protein
MLSIIGVHIILKACRMPAVNCWDDLYCFRVSLLKTNGRFAIQTYNLGAIRVYLVGYIFCIIDCHICQDIFGRIDIMYYRLPYVSRGVLPLKTLVLYIYRSRGTMQYNQQLYAIYSSNMV